MDRASAITKNAKRLNASTASGLLVGNAEAYPSRNLLGHFLPGMKFAAPAGLT